MSPLNSELSGRTVYGTFIESGVPLTCEAGFVEAASRDELVRDCLLPRFGQRDDPASRIHQEVAGNPACRVAPGECALEGMET